MDLCEYQRLAAATDQRAHQRDALPMHVLGLAGEAGSVAAEYKKRLRDGPAHLMAKLRLREELGDVLWYLAAVARHADLDLDEVASANLEKTRHRWNAGPVARLDDAYPPDEQLPRHGTYEFVPAVNNRGRPVMTVRLDGRQVGDPLTDASFAEDDYRFHDVFHLSYAVLLGWSAVSRALLKRKRRSSPSVDENEDGGRAVVVEEGISAMVFGYAVQHDLLAGVRHVDQSLLDVIEMMTGGFEVGVRSAAEWERAILAGFGMFRELVAHGGGRVHFDADRGQLRFEPPAASGG